MSAHLGRPRTREKIKELEGVAAVTASLREQGKTVVQCHGAFDLLHIGHIRHLEEAKHLGDVLVVTVTPDRYVNKGPHRPAFSEALRAEALAALDCVDYVAINRWPTAVEAIHLLRPHLYAKGPDYQDSQRDQTGGILLEEDAVRSTGGRLVITNDVVFSSSSLINRHFPVFTKEVSDYLAAFSARYNVDEVLGYLQKAQALKVLVVGEAIIDEYQYCDAIGKSSKEPMLALRRLSTEQFAGGILAVGNHVANFCGDVSLVTMLGEENSYEGFIRDRLDPVIHPHFVYRSASPTIVKRRFIDNYSFAKLLEVYEMSDGALEPRDEVRLCDILSEQVPQHDVVIVVDFGHGMLTPKAINILCSQARFLAVNAQSNAGNLGYHSISRYPRADYISMALNEVQLEVRDRRGDLSQMVLEVSGKLSCEKMAVTRGRDGCLCYSQKEGFVEVPAVAGQVVDRMGAGDAFLSLSALCAAQQAPIEVVGLIGNAAGAQAVATVGHRRSVERVPLFKHIEALLK